MRDALPEVGIRKISIRTGKTARAAQIKAITTRATSAGEAAGAAGTVTAAMAAAAGAGEEAEEVFAGRGRNAERRGDGEAVWPLLGTIWGQILFNRKEQWYER